MSLWRDRPLWDLLGLLLLLSWFCLLNGWRTTAALLSAALLHEAGHWTAVRLLGGGPVRLRVSPFGAVMESDGLRLSYAGELAAVAAGPGMNLLGGVLLPLALPEAAGSMAAGANWVLGLFNLLPAAPLDGWRALQLLLCWRLGPDRGAAWSAAGGAVGTLSVLGLLVWLMAASGGNAWLALPAAVLAVNGWRCCFFRWNHRK